MLEREEYVEQAYFFDALAERITQSLPMQDVLASVHQEILASTKLPLAIDYLLDELKHGGALAPAMWRLGHYFAPFQSYVMAEAEDEQGRFDLRVGLQILRHEAQYRADGCPEQGLFLFQFECLCRNRLGYDRGIGAMAGDPVYNAAWKEWLLDLRRQVGIIDVADLIYVRSEHYRSVQARLEKPIDDLPPVLFGKKEGRIALAHRRKDPLLLFSSLHRHLGYPQVPRPKLVEETADLLASLARRVERFEARLRLLEEEQRGGIDLGRFCPPPDAD
ncbi:MAG: hypothetical protein ACC645_04975 [Pirellulales bacterium]